MSNSLRTPEDYELFLYSLIELFPSVTRSTVVFIRLGATLARVSGELYFKHNVRAVIRERLIYDSLPAMIDSYGYEVWRGKDKLYWYDSQPHPDDTTLKSTEPHHKHIQPDIKNHRIPAPEMSFSQPNLPALIAEIETLLESIGEVSKERGRRLKPEAHR
jgi:hypothetical protein